MNNTIPVWKTSLASVAVIVAHFGTWFRLSALVLGIILAILLGSALLTMDAMQEMLGFARTIQSATAIVILNQTGMTGAQERVNRKEIIED